MNSETLGEETSPEYELQYVDISNVDSTGNILGAEEFRFENAPSRARRKVRSGDTIVSTVRTYLKAIAYLDSPPDNLIVSTGFAVLRPRAELHPPFLWRLVQSEQFVQAVQAHSEGVGYPAINPGQLGRLVVWIPKLDEQRAIAAFLDRETVKIDTLVAKKERLIDLLQEKRAALITHAVTKGLDPTAPMKASGVEWLGQIPAHWEVRRLKYLALLNPESLGEDTEPELEMVYVDIGGVNSLGRIAEKESLIFASAPSRARRLVRNGDVIVSTVRTYLRSIAPIRDPEPGLVVSTGFAVVRPSDDLTTNFAAYALRAPYFVERVVANSKGVSFPAINESEMATYELAKPPAAEQRAIAAFLDREIAEIDALIGKVREGIEKLKEYRTAISSAAVTGKIDVREPLAQSGQAKTTPQQVSAAT